MTKTPILQSLKWLFLTCLAAYGLGYLSILTLSYIFNIPEMSFTLIPFMLVALTLGIFYYRQLNRLDNILPVKEKKQLKATNARSIQVNGTHTIFLSQVRSIFSHEPNSALWWKYGNYTIKEDTAYEWLRKGWNRQLKGEPHPFSGNWIIRQRFHTLSNQRIKRDYHESLCRLASDYQLWLKEPSQGTSGLIIASPAGCIAKLRGKW